MVVEKRDLEAIERILIEKSQKTLRNINAGDSERRDAAFMLLQFYKETEVNEMEDLRKEVQSLAQSLSDFSASTRDSLKAIESSLGIGE